MAKRKPLVYREFIQAQKAVARSEHRVLSPKEYLDTINPEGHRSTKSARDYMRRIEKGQRSGAKIEARAKSGGGTYNARFRDENGDIRTATVAVPEGQTRFGIYKKRKRKEWVEAGARYWEHRYEDWLRKLAPGEAQAIKAGWRKRDFIGLRKTDKPKYFAMTVGEE